jgi:short-subunit dehydrogenase
MRLAGSSVLLTGATGGIGRVLAQALNRSGAHLILSGRRADVLRSLAVELGARTIVADLAAAADLRQLAEQAGEVDILVANAALPASGHLLELTQDEIDGMLDVDLRAPIALVRALAPGMVARGRGQVVLISSLAGKAATPGSSIYNAAKFGLRGFAHAARADLRSAGVGVSVVLPGFVREAGMFADTGLALPRGVGTSSPAQVAAAVISAIEHNRAEVSVAPPAVRLGAGLAAVAPSLAALGQRALGGGALAERVSAAQSGKRPPRS